MVCTVGVYGGAHALPCPYLAKAAHLHITRNCAYHTN
jgi:hypothetical protein